MESPFIPIGISGLYLAIIFATVPTFPNVLYFHVDKIQLPVKTKGEEHAWTLGFLHCYNLFNVLMNLFIAAGVRSRSHQSESKPEIDKWTIYLLVGTE